MAWVSASTRSRTASTVASDLRRLGGRHDEVCDGLDNDFDGLVDGDDDDLVTEACENQGVCNGAQKPGSLYGRRLDGL